MDKEWKLTILKKDLQMLTSANDEYLKTLLEAADSFVQREGIKNDGSMEYDMIQIQYAAYLFRRRAGTDTTMPRYLRWEMNNLLFAQKAGGKNGV